MELIRALAALAEPPGPEQERLPRLLRLPPPPGPAEHTELFDFLFYPRAAVYLGPEGMFGGEAADRIAGFWQAAALEPPSEPDHLCMLLVAYATLAEREGRADGARRVLVREARKALLWEHLLSWLPVYLTALARIAGPHYRAWSRLLERALVAEAEACGPPARAPLHLREAPALPEPRAEGGEAFLNGLLAPARTGFIVTRADLARGAASRGLGLRQAERRFALRAMLGQDAKVTLRWLRDEAGSWAGRHAALPASLEPVRGHWVGRAAATRALLAELARQPEVLAG